LYLNGFNELLAIRHEKIFKIHQSIDDSIPLTVSFGEEPYVVWPRLRGRSAQS
jgi:hypothetical protein